MNDNERMYLVAKVGVGHEVTDRAPHPPSRVHQQSISFLPTKGCQKQRFAREKKMFTSVMDSDPAFQVNSDPGFSWPNLKRKKYGGKKINITIP